MKNRFLKCLMYLTLAFGIVATFIFVQNRIEESVHKNEARLADAHVALVKKAVFETAVLYEKWYAKNGNNYSGFLENKDNAAEIESIINEVKSKSVDAYYYTQSTKDGFVIKILPASSKVFYCFDSKAYSKSDLEVESIVTNDVNYKSLTFCSGEKI